MVVHTLALLCSTAAILATPPGGDERDTVVLKNGKEIHCRVVLELADRVAIRLGTREKWIPRKKIKSIDSIAISLRNVIQQFDAAPDEAAKFLELAKLCEKKNLPHESRLFYWRVLLEEPKHAAANLALGHKRSGKAWRVPLDGAWRNLDQVERVHAKWVSAREMRSEHFALRTDAGLRLAIETLLELESFYSHLYDLFQRKLEMREITDPIPVHLHKSRDQFPRLSRTVDAYYSLEDNILFTFIAEGGRPLTLFRTATHAVIYNLGGSKRARQTELPGWLHEGWGDYMEGCLTAGKHGRVKLDLARRIPGRIGNLRAEKKLYKLRRLLIFKRSDFEASTRQRVKYAQSYALMLFMMEGDNARYQDKFLDYMKDTLVGKASAAAFRRVFKKDLKAIEKGHKAVK